MLKSCSKCGRIHDHKFICEAKQHELNKKTSAQKFRSSYAWYKKQKEIKQRDIYLCRVCLTNKYQTTTRYNSSNLSVHHIVPIQKDFEKRLDDDNLITLCSYHHKLSEAGKIPKNFLLSLAKSPPTLSIERK